LHILPTSTPFLIKCWNSAKIHAVFIYRHIPLNEPIDLLNVAFENPRKIKVQHDNVRGFSSQGPSKPKQQSPISANDYALYEVPDRITGMEEVNELRRLCPGRTWNFVSNCAYYLIMGPLQILSIQVEINVPFEVSLIFMCFALIVMVSYYLGVSRYASSGRGTHDTRTNRYGSCKLLLVLIYCT
jgi:hypothetical protein